MKKLMLLALSMAMSGVVLAHDAGLSASQGQNNNDFLQGMNEIHDVMHNTSISAKQTDNGITFSVTAESDSAIKSINKRFVDEQAKLETYLKGVDVTVHSLDNGVEVVLASNDKNIINQLNASGRSLVYRYLHEGTAAFSGSKGYRRSSYGSGMMNGWSNQYDMGHGMQFRNGSDDRGELGNYQQYNHNMGNESGMM